MQKNELRNITEKIVEKERLPINGGIELLSACKFPSSFCLFNFNYFFSGLISVYIFNCLPNSFRRRCDGYNK